MKTKILMVDDSNSAIELVKSYIDDYEVIGAGSGQEMWEALKENIPELILLDIIMPEEDGFQIAGRLAKNEKYSEIPIIFISAKNTGKDVLEGLKLDVYDYIKKPFDRFELLARINATLKRKELEKKLRDSSVKDYLTDCFNRRYLYDRVSQQISIFNRTRINFTIALIDLDNFKKINDTHGHLAGDHILAEFGSVLKKNVRNYDVPVRFGGEEFAVLYPNSTKEDAAKSIDHIKNIIKGSPPLYEKKEIPFTFSCGIVEAREISGGNNPSFEVLMNIADERLYKGKASGKDSIVIT